MRDMHGSFLSDFFFARKNENTGIKLIADYQSSEQSEESNIKSNQVSLSFAICTV